MVKKNSLISFEVKLPEMMRYNFERALEDLCESGRDASDCHIYGECHTCQEKGPEPHKPVHQDSHFASPPVLNETGLR